MAIVRLRLRELPVRGAGSKTPSNRNGVLLQFFDRRGAFAQNRTHFCARRFKA
jgi:hypothetical protein